MADTWEIRPIKPKSIFRLNWCSEGTCCETATHYLVLHPNRPLSSRESRMRRCEKHAKENAQRMGIPFPTPETRP